MVNGLSLSAGSGGTVLNSGDTIKFGGAGSEFMVEKKDFSVFISVGVSDNNLNLKIINELSSKYGFPVENDPRNALYFILNDDFSGLLDANLVTALLLAKYIVSPTHFTTQLLNSEPNRPFSLALIQPSIVSKLYPMDCWTPQRSRLLAFKNVFEGIKRFLVLDDSCDSGVVSVMRVIGEIIGGIQTHQISGIDEDFSIPFNELLILPNNSEFTVKVSSKPLRSVSYPSILEALVRSDSKLININTIYPLTSTVKIVEEGRSEKPKPKPPKINLAKNEIPAPVPVIISAAVPIDLHDEDEDGTSPSPSPSPSLTTLIPMPSNLFIVPKSKTSKFVKCHPKHRQPGTIPALIGPEQLQASRPLSTSSTSAITTKRRVLVRDSWLAEDDNLVEPVPRDKVNTLNNNNLSHANNLQSNLNKSTTNNAPPTSPTSTSTSTSSAPVASKFQSAFFKNLTKAKGSGSG